MAQHISRPLWNANNNYRVHKSSPLDPVTACSCPLWEAKCLPSCQETPCLLKKTKFYQRSPLVLRRPLKSYLQDTFNNCFSDAGWNVHFFFCYDGVRLCFCGTAAANGPTVHLPEDTRVNMEHRRHDNDSRKRNNSEQNLSSCHSAHHMDYLGPNQGLRDE